MAFILTRGAWSDAYTHSVRRQQWLDIITACQSRPEDTTAKQWLKDNGVKEKAYYYWLRKFRKESFEQMGNLPSDNRISFAEIHLQNESEQCGAFECGFKPDAVIKTQGCVIALSNTISESLCRIIMEGLNHAL